MAIKIILADDHALIRDGLQTMIDREVDFQIVGQASNGREIVDMVKKLNPDIIIMDISMPELNGIEATRHIKEFDEDIKIIALSVHSEISFVRQMLKAGASGYLVKHSEFKELVRAIRSVAEGQIYLSPNVSGQVIGDYLHNLSSGESSVFTKLSNREREILQMLAEGKTKHEIADILHLSIKTIESHRQNIMNKLNIDRFPDLIRYAIREGITEL
ncbi:MAG: response regulator transcription factor [Calditrichaceae bacterium]|jgi:two-component system, NarL family, response regulator NreC